jgi:outer membrane protein assembly factor BamB
MKRALAVTLLLLVLPGCSWVTGILGGEDNAEPPVPLTKLEDPLKLKKLWSKGVGVGNEEQYLKLVPASADGQIYVADHKGRVTALDALTGKKNWQVKTDVPISAGPGAGEGLVLLGTSNAEVLALDAGGGGKRWVAAVSSEVLSVPQIDLGRVIVQTVDGNVTALDAETGAQLWVFDRSVPVLTLRGTSTPAVQHGVVVAGFANGKLVAMSADKGFVGWEANIAIPQGRSELERIVDIDGDPIIVGTAVYVATYQGSIGVIDLQSGNSGWKRDMSSYLSLGVDFSQVYVTDAQSHVWALSRSTGSTVWKTEDLAYRGLTAPEPFNEYIAVGDYEGYVHLLSRYDGRIVARARVDSDGIRARPLVVGDVLYVFGNSGKLAAFTLPAE